MINSEAGNISPQRYAQKVALHEVCRLHGLGQEWIAIMLKKSQGTISKWLNPASPEFPGFEDWNDLIKLLREHTGSIEPIRAFCNWHGADAVALTHHGCSLDPKTLGRLTSIIARKEGHIVSLLVQILEDGKVDGMEEHQLADTAEDIEALYVAVGDLRERALAARKAAPKRRRA